MGFSAPFRSSFIAPIFSPGGAVVAYTLYDVFTTNRAAGAVNGTTSESPVSTGGGVTRAVTDTTNKLSINSGRALFAGSVTDFRDPRLTYAATTRTSGRVLIVLINSLNITIDRAMFGWSASQSTQATMEGLYLNQGIIVQWSGNLTTGVPYSASTDYQYAIVLRSTGAWYFIKGGAFANWTLFWISSANSTATLYPYMGIQFETNNRQLDNIRIPVSTYIPNPLAYDTFTRANGALGNTETSGPDSQSMSSLAWTDRAGTYTVSSNKAQASALSGGISASTVTTASQDVMIDAALTRSAGNVGIVARWQDSSNYLIAYHDGTNARLDKVVAGVTTNLISVSATYGAGRILRLGVDGTGARLYYHDALIGSLATIPSSTYALHGLYTTDTGNTQDNFTIYPTGTSSNEHSALDIY